MVLKHRKKKDKDKDKPVPDDGNVSGDRLSEREKMVACAKANLKKPYVWGTHGPNSFDCSGLVGFCFKQATGRDIGYGSVNQFTLGTPVDPAHAQPGDVFFYDTFDDPPGHDAIYIGDGKIIHALNKTAGVVQSDANANMGGNNRLMGVRNLGFADTPVKPEPVTPDVVSLLGAPTGTITGDFKIVGDGIKWSRVNRWDTIFLAAGAKHKVDPAWLKAMAVIESGGEMVWNHNGTGAYGIMQIKPAIWGARAQALGYDLMTPEGSIGAAAAILSGDIPGRGTTVEERFLENYYPVRDAQGNLCPDCNGEDGSTPNDYLHDIHALMAQIHAAVPDDGTTPAVDPWRPYPYPKMVDLLVTKPGDGAGFDRVAFRRPRIRGFCTHITDGPPSQSIEFFQAFFSTGGQRAYDALTDLVIGWDGRIGLLNDWRDPKRGGTRAGWANGGVDGLEEEGLDFYRAFPDINSCLVSAEHTQVSGGRWSDAMLASTIEIRTAIAQELKCPWDHYPYHPAYNGVSIEQKHRNFATKSCPANPYINEYDAVVRKDVQAKLKEWQGGQAGPPPVTPPSVTYTKYGFSLADIQEFFGTIVRHNEDGTTDEFGFNENGALSLLWLNRCDAEGKFPEAERIWYSDAQFVKGKEMWASWEGGWTAYLPLVDSRASWQWLDAKQ